MFRVDPTKSDALTSTPPQDSPSETTLTDQSSATPSSHGWMSRRRLATAGIVVLLGIVAVWGHASDWSFNKLAGHSSAEGNEWCKEHNVPEAECIECNSKLVP